MNALWNSSTEVQQSIGARELAGDNKIAKVSVVGVGMRSHAGVATRMFDALAAENINILMIATSEIKISVVVAERYLELAVRCIHSEFNLGEEAVARRPPADSAGHINELRYTCRAQRRGGRVAEGAPLLRAYR